MLDVALIVAPVFVCAAVGYGWVALGRPFDRALMTRLLHELGAPCLVFSSLVQMKVSTDALGEVATAAAGVLVISAVVALMLLRAWRLPVNTYLPPLVFGNSGNMGLPLCLFAFGETGLALGVAYFATVSLVHFTAGIWVWSGRISPAELLGTPLTWAVAASLFVLTTGVRMPVWVVQTTELLGGITIPLMLLTLGASLHDLGLSGIPRSVGLSAVRLALGFAAGWGISEILGLEGVIRGVVIVEASMPVAVFNFLFAERYGRSPESVASLVVVSTLLAFLTTPLVLRFAL